MKRSAPLRKRFRIALKRRRKRLLYQFLAIGAGPPVDVRQVDLGRCRRVLLLRELNTMGDAMLATPAVRALKRAHPHLELAIGAGRRNALLWAHNPRLSRVFVLRGGVKGVRFFELVRELRAWRPDACLTLESIRCHATLDVLARLSGAPVRVRYDGAAFGMPHTNTGYNCLVPFVDRAAARDGRPRPGALHQVDVCAGVLRPLGILLEDRTLELVPGAAAGETAARVLAAAGVVPGEAFAVLHPGSKQVHNRWPPERFLAVYEHCRRVHRLRALLSFGPSEQDVRKWFGAGRAEPADLLPPLSILELAALLQRARLLVCPDTGVLHVGVAAGVPAVALYGSGDPHVWQPPGPVRTISDHVAGHVRQIEVPAVLREVDAALGS